MKKFDQCLGAIEKWIGIIVMFTMAVCILLQVFFRLVGVQVAWTEELAVYMFISITYYGSIYAFRHKKHLKVEILDSFLGDRGRYILCIISNIFTIVFFIIFTKLFIDYFTYLGSFNQVSPVMRIDIRIVYFAPLLMGILGLYELIKNTIILIKTKEV